MSKIESLQVWFNMTMMRKHGVHYFLFLDDSNFYVKVRNNMGVNLQGEIKTKENHGGEIIPIRNNQVCRTGKYCCIIKKGNIRGM
jgi:hypothetical protein